MKEKIFNRVKTELRAGGRGPTSHYEPSKITQEPFIASVLAVELSKGFKGLRIDKYDGSTDPVDHATSYHDVMRQVGYNNAEQCQGFSRMLVGPARCGSRTSLSTLSQAIRASLGNLSTNSTIPTLINE